MSKLIGVNAVIAQQVERILGKDEVASSNLANSSILTVIPIGVAVFLYDENWRPLNACNKLLS